MRRLRPKKSIPVPPQEMRDLVGGVGIEAFENPDGEPVYPYLPPTAYESVFDFGCGCGRIARQLLLQRSPPVRYLGVDIHRGMINWCQLNLTSFAPTFEFQYHDVFAAGLNPAGTARTLPLPGQNGTFTLFNAISVFTHLAQDQAEHYLKEAARLLSPDGYMNATWFLFDKVDFPMMQSFQDALYINDTDPTNAVIFDRQWLRRTADNAGLRIVQVLPPAIRGFQWTVVLRHRTTGDPEVELPPDLAPPGISRPPLLPPDAARIGLDGRDEDSLDA